MDEFEKILKKIKDMLKAMWCGDEACEDKIKELTGAKSRCIPLSRNTYQINVYVVENQQLKWFIGEDNIKNYDYLQLGTFRFLVKQWANYQIKDRLFFLKIICLNLYLKVLFNVLNISG